MNIQLNFPPCTMHTDLNLTEIIYVYFLIMVAKTIETR